MSAMLAFLLALPLGNPAFARELYGVTMPDRSTVGGAAVTLNGMGLREKYFFDIYVGGLYLTHLTHDGPSAIAADEPKRVDMHFVYREVTKEQMMASMNDDFGRQPGIVAHRDTIARMVEWLPASVRRGDTVSFAYTPGVGTELLHNGRRLGLVPGSDFMRLVFGIYLGDHPPTAALKAGLLGG